MRPIILLDLHKRGPLLAMTRKFMIPHLRQALVAPITGAVRGLLTEIPIGSAKGFDHESVVNCANITTVLVNELGQAIGYLLPHQEAALVDAIRFAYDLE